MFDEARCDDVEAMGGAAVSGTTPGCDVDWRVADRALQRLAGRRAALDEEEARWLIVARRAEVHVHRGFATFLEYVERVLGHAPHAARERMRVAEALPALPATRAAMAAGRVGYSAVRELTRVATADTEVTWLAAVADKTVREIEAAVAGRRPGDRPDAPPDPAHAQRTLRLELSPSTFALFVAARRALEDTCGHSLTDDDMIALLCRGELDGLSHVGQSEHPNQPPHQIAITTCADCGRAWQDAAGQTVEISATEVERAGCDATLIGRVDRGEPTRVTRTIPPATRRAVMRRDRGRCVAPGCRGSRFVDVHHLVPRAAGGDHHASRLSVLCTSHHRAVHDGRLRIEGTAPHALRFFHADGRTYGGPPADQPRPAVETEPDHVDDARRALTKLGISAAVAREAVERAVSHVGPAAPLPALMAAALRACPRPRLETIRRSDGA